MAGDDDNGGAGQNPPPAHPQRIVSSIGPFDTNVEDWTSYSERLEQYFVANGIPEDKKVAGLIGEIGGETYKLLRKLTFPAKPSTKSYTELVELLQKHLAPPPIVIAERFRFHKRDQQQHENVNDYVAELRQLAINCNFGDYLNEALRDRFVCGLRREAMQRALLSEADLDLAKAVKIANSMEMASRDAGQLRNNGSPGVHQMQRQPLRSSRRSTQPGKTCYRCNKTGHLPDDCRFKDAECYGCGKKGHIKPACRGEKRQNAKNRQKPRKLHALHTHENNTDNPSDDDEFPVCSLETIGNMSKSDINNTDPIIVTPTVDGQQLPMELDTGSGVTVVPKSMYDEMNPRPKISQTKDKLKTYTGEIIKPLGVARVQVTMNNQTEMLDMYITENGQQPLFGRSWLRKLQLDWKAIKVHHQPMLPSSTSTLQKLLEKHKDVFKEEIGELKGITTKLKVKENATPKFHKARPVPYALRSRVEDELDRLEKQGIITKVNHSEWGTPIVPVVKPNGSVRVCGDYKVTVNPVLEVEQYPLPRIEDIFANLAGGQHFSKLDLRQAYHQMVVDDESKDILTINTHKGLYQYNRLVFGIASAPAIWQRTMDQILQDIPNTQCLLDDIIITGKTESEHLDTLRRVLERLEQYGLRAKLNKCEFFQDEIIFCGHKINKDGLHKTQDKIESVMNAPQPQNVSQLRSFLGLINYYHRFLPDLATVLHPLHRLLIKDMKWKWDSKCEQAFKKAKDLIASDQVLTHYDPSLPVQIATDASPYGLGAVLSHMMPDGSERPIAFASRSLNQAERGYSQIDKEALAIIWGVKHFYLYLYGRHFTLVTDHQPLVAIFNPVKGIPVMTAARLQRYALFLAGLTYKIIYRSTTKHGNADAMSRLPVQDANVDDNNSSSLDALDILHMTTIANLPVTCEQVKRETQRDPILARVYDYILKGWPNEVPEDMKPYQRRKNETSLCQGCIMWGYRVVIPPKLRPQVLEELHSGHLGIVKMKSLARGHVWWPNIDVDIERMAKNCAGCQEHQKAPTQAPLHPWEWPSDKWQRIHVDYAGPFLGHMFLVVVDAYSKWPEVVITNSTTSTQTIEILRTIFGRNGVPEQLVSDNGPCFTSQEFQTFMKRNGIKHITSAPFKPSTNGLAERFVQSMKSSLRSMKKEEGSVQSKLTKFLMSYRNTPQSTTGETPSMLLNNRPLRSRLDLIKPNLRKKVNNKQLDMAATRKTTDTRQLNIGQSVWVRDYRGQNKWIQGTVLSRTGPLSYQIQINDNIIWRRHIDQIVTGLKQPATTTDTSESQMDLDIPRGTQQNSREIREKETPQNDIITSPNSETAKLRRSQRVRKPPDRLTYYK